jgi:hypothetical protein
MSLPSLEKSSNGARADPTSSNMGAAKAELPDCHQQQRPQLQPDGTDRTMTGGGISSGLLRTHDANHLPGTNIADS